MNIKENIQQLKSAITNSVTLVAVSKTKPVEAIQEAYQAGQRDFGENYVQELCDKYEVLPKDINWHFIGHLQSNKVKYIAPFVYLIHSVDSFKLLKEIDKQAAKNKRVINCLLQIYIATEDSKFGFDPSEAQALLNSEELKTLKNVQIVGFMGMASNTEDEFIVRKEFAVIKKLFDLVHALKTPNTELQTLSYGMSTDYKIAIEEGSNMVRIGSSIFGERNYNPK